MVEIAIALGVIGFALVAIIGVLPRGLEVQRDNRAETVINQDATFWAEAIRNGATGIDNLTNHVESITIVEWNDIFARSSILSSNYYVYGPGPQGYLSGSNIIGLLTTRALNPQFEVRAVVSAMSGAASEKGATEADRELAFRYRMNVDIYRPLGDSPSFTSLSTNHTVPAADIMEHLYEVRLGVSYPIVTPDRPGPRRQVFRTTVAREVRSITNSLPFHYFFVP